MCTTWIEHDWDEPRLIENGRHPTMGRYDRYVVTCRQCRKQTTMTEWRDLTTAAVRREDQRSMRVTP